MTDKQMRRRDNFVSLYILSGRLGVEQYVLRYWCKEFKIPIQKNKVFSAAENVLSQIKYFLREERFSIAETKKLISK